MEATLSGLHEVGESENRMWHNSKIYGLGGVSGYLPLVMTGQPAPTSCKKKIDFSSIRDMFFSKLESKIPFLRLQSHETLLSQLMYSTDYFINIQLISFISSCFELRDNLISGIINPTDE